MANKRIVKAEALLRWFHPERGLVPPDNFIPVAEESGIIIELGNWVLSQVLVQAVKWRNTYCDDFQISVNTSPVQFRSAECFQDAWFARLNETGLTGDGIIVEITEGMLIETSPVVSKKLLHFRDTMIEVALDDFGTGYSSLSYLKRFDIDYLKIDRSFVSNLTAESATRVLCEAIVVMAHKLGIKVIAEGVETQEQYELLTAAGCDYGQGYLFSQALPPDEFEQLFDNVIER
jgi:EAL domain-containing protein (putative c-di-GMP-specific phosphodiesterase class I)